MARFSPPLDNWSDREKTSLLRDLARRVIVDSFAWDPGSVSANSYLDTTLTAASYPAVTGLRAGMWIALTPPAGLNAGLLFTAWVATDNTLTIRLRNLTGSPVDTSSGTWSLLGVLL